MKRTLAFVLTMLMMLSLSACGGVNLNFTGVSPFRNIRDEAVNAQVDTLVSTFADEHGLEGISAGVISGKETRFVNIGEGMGEHTVMPIGTMTNMFVGMLAADHERIGYLDRNQNVSDWLNSPVDIPQNSGEDIKVWHLAANMSGLGDADTFDNSYLTAGMMYQQLPNSSFSFGLGEGHYESSLGYALLSETLRQTYNMNANFVNLVNNQVISKMQLNDSSFARGDSLAGFNGYQTTTYDLLKVVGYCTGALNYDEALTKTLALAMEPVGADSGRTLAFEYGKMGSEDKVENYVYFRAGEMDGISSYIAFIPELDIGVSLIARGDADLESLGVELLSVIK
ncbi:MAG: serine hydrolase [Clostridia bacterium]|nr:serine hydrolase [Clostridia bacterium]